MKWTPGRAIYPLLVVLFAIVACTCPIVPAVTHDPATVTLHGTVLDPDSDQPVEGAIVQLWISPYANRTGDQYTTTGENGTFTFEPIEITAENAVTVTLTYNVATQQLHRSGVETLENPAFDFQVNIDTPPVAGDLGWYALSGQVSDADSKLPVAGAQVGYSHFSYNRSQPPQTVITDSEGRFTLAPVFIHDTDSSTFSVEKDGYLPTEIRFAGMDIYYRTLIEIPLQPDGG